MYQYQGIPNITQMNEGHSNSNIVHTTLCL